MPFARCVIYARTYTLRPARRLHNSTTTRNKTTYYTIGISTYIPIPFLFEPLFFRPQSCRGTLAMSLLDLPNELLLPIFTSLIGQFIYTLALKGGVLPYRLWDPVTTLQLVCRPTRTLILAICRQIAALPADDPHETVDPPRSVPRHIAHVSPTLSGVLPQSYSTISRPGVQRTRHPLASARRQCHSAALRAYAAFTYTLRVAREDMSSLITAGHLARQVNPRELSKLIIDGIDQHSEFITWGNACWLRVPHTILRFLAEKRIGNWINAMVEAKSRPNEITEEVNFLFHFAASFNNVPPF